MIVNPPPIAKIQPKNGNTFGNFIFLIRSINNARKAPKIYGPTLVHGLVYNFSNSISSSKIPFEFLCKRNQLRKLNGLSY